jgi:ATP-dependent RNA helicase RhlE
MTSTIEILRATPAGFDSLGLPSDLLDAIGSAGWITPTPIQATAIPPVLAGKDVIGCAQTGTGKTGAFVLPMIERLARSPVAVHEEIARPPAPVRAPQGGIQIKYAGIGLWTAPQVGQSTADQKRARPRGLVLAPTRELAQQTADQAERFGDSRGIRTAVLVGGLPLGPQVRALACDPQIVVATPGRLLDHIERGTLTLDGVEILVLDEADRMLDMGFADQIDLILEGVPRSRQTLLFSATMPAAIESLARSRMRRPVRVQIGLNTQPPERTEQAVYLAKGHAHKTSLLLRLLTEEPGSVLVFARTKQRAEKLMQTLRDAGFHAARIHSDLTQGQRERSLDGFRSGYYRILVATDVASRGIDVEHIAHVVNYDLPLTAEDYVHRVGRTSRAHRTGRATSFASPEERAQLRAIEKVLGRPVPRGAETHASA